MRLTEHRIRRQREPAQLDQRIEQLVDRRFAQLGKRRVRRAPARREAAGAAHRALPSRGGCRSARRRSETGSCWRICWLRERRRCRVLRPRRTRDPRASRPAAQANGSGNLRCEDAFGITRAASVGSARPDTRLGKNGGTQSKWVDRTTRAFRDRRDDVEARRIVPGCSVTANPRRRR